jgi:hypothetical protein
MMERAGYREVSSHPHAGWRGPILQAFIGKKPE